MTKQKQLQTNFRTTAEMKRRLEAAATANGLTFNKEVNRRLAESFDQRRELDPVFNDRVLFGMLIVVAKGMSKTGSTALAFKDDTKNRQEWHTDAYAFARAIDAAVEILKLMQPPGDADLPQFGIDQKRLVEAMATLGHTFGRRELQFLTQGKLAQDDPLRELIGEPMLERIEANLERLK
jgi:hypothetical protein